MTHISPTSPPASVTDRASPNLILVGLPGSGKSTVGQAVATRLGRAFLDLDHEIERRERRTVAQIFAHEGEAYFRRRERELTAELTTSSGMIVSPGGGWVTNPDVVSLVRPTSQLIYLRVTPEAALRHLARSKTIRPLLVRPDPLGELRRMFEERKAAYESADHVVSTELYDLQGVIQKVVELATSAR